MDMLQCYPQFVPPHLPNCVHKSVLYVCISTAARQISPSVPSFQIPYICIKIRLLFSFWLTSLSVKVSRFIYLIRTDPNMFLLWLSNIPLYIYMYSNFFIHSSVDGHLGCFHAPGIVNNAAINIWIHVSFSSMISSGYMPLGRIFGHMVVILLLLLRNAYYSP